MEHFSLSPLQLILRLALTFLGLLAVFGVIIIIMLNFPGLGFLPWLLIFAAGFGIAAFFLAKKKKNESD